MVCPLGTICQCSWFLLSQFPAIHPTLGSYPRARINTKQQQQQHYSNTPLHHLLVLLVRPVALVSPLPHGTDPTAFSSAITLLVVIILACWPSLDFIIYHYNVCLSGLQSLAVSPFVTLTWHTIILLTSLPSIHPSIFIPVLCSSTSTETARLGLLVSL